MRYEISNPDSCKPAPETGGVFLPLARYRLRFDATRPIRMTDFPGSAWRGALGHTLKGICCTTHLPLCPSCPEYRRCGYPEIFETPPPPDATKMRKYLHAPHPFVLEHRTMPSGLPAADRRCDLVLALIGRGNEHLPLFVEAFHQAAQNPPGISGNPLHLERIERETAPGSEQWEAMTPAAIESPAKAEAATIPSAPANLTLHLMTPLRIKRDGGRVGPEDFRFSDLFSNLLRRISMLTYFHTSTPLETSFRELTDAARSIHADANLTWRDLSRYSSRQKTEMRLGGLLGQLQISGADLSAFWPFLWLGQWTHAGTGATMGLGRYAIHASLQASGSGLSRSTNNEASSLEVSSPE